MQASLFYLFLELFVFLGHDFKECIHHLRVELAVDAFLNKFNDSVAGQPLTVGTIRDQGIVMVGYSEDAGPETDIFTTDAVRIPTAIIILVVLQYDGYDASIGINWFQYTSADTHMFTHELIFLIGQFARLVENFWRNAYLAYIMK